MPSAKTPKADIDDLLRYGVVCIDKPCGPSSHEVAAFVRNILHLKRTGHTGTLDQNVSGVLVVLLEDSCKMSHYLMGSRKKYECVMRTEKPVAGDVLEDAFSHFRGRIFQTPPLASAVAKKLRVREVYRLDVLEADGRLVLFECETEAGTYIRKIVSDAGEVLGVRTEMAELRRTAASTFSEGDAVTLQQLTDYFWLWKERGDASKLGKTVHSVDEVVGKAMKKAVLKEGAMKKALNGVKPLAEDFISIDIEAQAGEAVAAFDADGALRCVLQMKFGASELGKRKGEAAADVQRVLRP
ncbi:MAG: RNA-guided pseudouridylation complex pseudouridine synthase subunit Cbf5 [Candidatus Micrarchaeota archaeon]